MAGHYPVYSGGEHGNTPSLIQQVGGKKGREKEAGKRGLIHQLPPPARSAPPTARPRCARGARRREKEGGKKEGGKKGAGKSRGGKQGRGTFAAPAAAASVIGGGGEGAGRAAAPGI